MNALQQIGTGIELLDGGYTVEWTPSRTSASGVHTMPYPNYDDRLLEALSAASQLVGTDVDYVSRVDKVANLNVAEMSREQLSTFLTWVQRGERFCDGFIDGFVQNGKALQALQRVVDLESDATEEIQFQG